MLRAVLRLYPGEFRRAYGSDFQQAVLDRMAAQDSSVLGAWLLFGKELFALLRAVAAASTVFPARRASLVDPGVTLREE